MAVRVCSHPDCGALVEGAGKCRRHRPRDRRPSAARRGYGPRWRALRKRFLRDHPRCECGDCAEPSTEAHHLDGLGPLGPLGHYEPNLQALCRRHHSATTAREQPGGWARDGKPIGEE